MSPIVDAPQMLSPEREKPSERGAAEGFVATFRLGKHF